MTDNEKDLRVHKFEFPLDAYATVRVPGLYQTLHYGYQDGRLFLWALVDVRDVAVTTLRYRIAGTGHPVEDNEAHKYIETVTDGQFVWHIFGVQP